ncbi:MAG: adenylate kinase [Candidatus Woesearchaeota archaeon]|nr:adenylate kinase [Candidatus Woesearchaeota archaeon]
MKIVLIGPQGSGKGTQAKMLQEKFNIPHISTGDIFREAISKGTEIGKKAKAIIESGKLVPDEITNKIVEERLKQDDCKNGFILDGYPRNLNQAKALDSFSKIDYVIEIDVPDKISVKRLSSRRQCKKCGAIYGITLIPKEEGICDKCGSELYQRDDDRPDAIKKRLEIYHKETEPILEYYRKKGILIRVDGTGSVENVFKEIKAKLKK